MGVKPDGSGGVKEKKRCPVCGSLEWSVPRHIRLEHDWD